MLPLYIKGFTPQQNGSCIMLPADITTISGSDFDVDKLYIMLYEFEKNKSYEYDKYKAYKDYNIEQEKNRDYNRKNNITDWEQPSFDDWFKENKHDYVTKENIEFKKIRYDHSKAPKDNTLQQRNNLLIDMFNAVLTNPDTAAKLLNPGGFDELKKTSRILKIVKSGTLNEIKNKLGLKSNDIYSELSNMSLEVLDKAVEDTKKQLDPLTPSTQLFLHNQNMTGGALIGVYANHNANHALMQHTDLGISESGSFTFDGENITKLNQVKNKNNDFISKNNSGFLAASVDNVKDPVLAELNQNSFTADTSMLLSRQGYRSLSIGLMMNQPIVLEMTNKLFREKLSKQETIKSVLEKYKNLSNLQSDLTYDQIKYDKFTGKELMDNILKHNTDFITEVEYLNQYKVGLLFEQMMTTGDALAKLVSVSRADTQNGGCGPTHADTIIKEQKLNDYIRDSELPNFPLENAQLITNNIEYNNIDELREKLYNSKLPYLQAFTTLGIQHVEKMMKPYFPHFTKSFKDVILQFKDIPKNNKLDVKTMNNIYNDLLAYIMTKTKFFGTDNSKLSEEKRDHFINYFPQEFNEILSRNPDIANLEFIKRLSVILANDNCPVETLVFKNVGSLSSILRENFMRDWSTLLYMDNKEANDLALDLVRYSFYRNGFAFGPSTFIHLAPYLVRIAVPEYIETLNSLMSNEDDYSDFVDQYILNHLDNRKFVPLLMNTSFEDAIKGEDIIKINIDKNSSKEDKKIIKKFGKLEGQDIYEFVDWFSVTDENKKENYYKLIPSMSDEFGNASYFKVQPLGSKSNFIEYEYGKSINELNSQIKSNNTTYSTDDNTSAFEENLEKEQDYLEPNQIEEQQSDKKDINSYPSEAKPGADNKVACKN